jgi:arsenate reductase
VLPLSAALPRARREGPYHVLFLCTGNSARSILAESLLGAIAGDRFVAHSAGSRPAGRVHPRVLAYLDAHGIATSGLRSKGWDEFAAPGAPSLDFVITVCDNAAGETCPVWPGHPATAHWGLPDPAAARTDADADRIIAEVAQTLATRLRRLASLPDDTLDRRSLQARLREIGTIRADAA